MHWKNSSRNRNYFAQSSDLFLFWRYVKVRGDSIYTVPKVYRDNDSWWEKCSESFAVRMELHSSRPSFPSELGKYGMFLQFVKYDFMIFVL